MAENRNAQQVREITDKLEQGLKELFESERFKEYLKTMSTPTSWNRDSRSCLNPNASKST